MKLPGTFLNVIVAIMVILGWIFGAVPGREFTMALHGVGASIGYSPENGTSTQFGLGLGISVVPGSVGEQIYPATKMP